MVNYLVALDESDNAKAAFFTAVYQMNRNRDVLYLMTVCEKGKLRTTSGKAQQDRSKNESKELLRAYERLCRAYSIKHHSILGISNSVGQMICLQVIAKNVDFLVMGRRGLGRFRRFFVGSNSQYCLEKAKCSVIIVKELNPTLTEERVKALRASEKEQIPTTLAPTTTTTTVPPTTTPPITIPSPTTTTPPMDERIAQLAKDMETKASIQEQAEGKEEQEEKPEVLETDFKEDTITTTTGETQQAV